MRRTTLVRTTAAAAAALILMGCGGEGGGKAGAGSGDSAPSSASTPTPPASSTPPTSPASPTPPAPSTSGGPAGCTEDVPLTAADNGRTVCLTRGGRVRIMLDGTKDRPWKQLAVRGDTLKAINAGIVLLPGDVNAAYEGVAPGTETLTSSRPLCASPEPGHVSCLGIQDWSVTVRVE
ncbi:hypothetical protein AB0F77_38670 [Streptomyces sp. NPDC026672]|uniref:hypothetical protein n=1 Tax=unclassified Streptomyces TaxID=2593676 RepID=UPI00340AE62F